MEDRDDNRTDTRGREQRGEPVHSQQGAGEHAVARLSDVRFQQTGRGRSGTSARAGGFFTDEGRA
jgi:hypothetical protein